tara:strand:- start:186 stop:698 length:513 start_codon:yes stop_codon:yes gene_type:complete
MNKEETYFFHQTPVELAKKILTFIPFDQDDIVFEPFAGEGAFYNNLPIYTTNISTEIEKGSCFRSHTDKVDWVVTNPPYNLELDGKKIRSSFWYLLKYFCNQSRKGVALLGNYNCLNSLNPKRLKELDSMGWYLNNIVICEVKKWRNRYFFMIFSRVKTNDCIEYVEGIY